LLKPSKNLRLVTFKISCIPSRSAGWQTGTIQHHSISLSTDVQN